MPLGIHHKGPGCVSEVTSGRPDEVCREVCLPGAATLALASREWLVQEMFLIRMVHSPVPCLPLFWICSQEGREAVFAWNKSFLTCQDPFLFQIE